MAIDREPRARRLSWAGSALVGCSVVGGMVSVVSGVNTWGNAWTSEATLAAPWPMMLVQGLSTVAAVGPRRRPAIAGSIVLGLSAAVAGVSGFFDGQLGRSDLGAGYVSMQWVYVVVALGTSALAASRLRQLTKSRVSQELRESE
jgi:hypothetical protein